MGTSRLALPVMILYSVLLWLGYLATDVTLWPSLVIFWINTYLMVELNNRNALMRQYSRMVSCSYIALMMMCPWLLRNMESMVVQFFFITSLSLLFHSYQQSEDIGHKYWAYLCLGCGCVFWPPMIILLPFYWIGEGTFLMSLSIKSFGASILGLLTPVWIAAPAIIYFNKYDLFFDRINAFVPSETLLSAFSDPTLLIPTALPLTSDALSITVFILLLLIIGIIHFFRNSYSEKIHVRMLYQFFTLVAVVVVLALLLTLALPFDHEESAMMLLNMTIVCTSPLLAHYITFTSTRLTNISVILLILIILAISVPQCLTPLLPY